MALRRRSDARRCRSTAGHSPASAPPVRSAASHRVATYHDAHRCRFSALATSSWLSQIIAASSRCVRPRAVRQWRSTAPNRSRADASGVNALGLLPITRPTQKGPHPDAALTELSHVLGRPVPDITGSLVVMAYALEAVVQDRLDDQGTAESALEFALELAEPGGVVLPFLLSPYWACWNARPGAAAPTPP